MEIPQNLISSAKFGRLVPFIGAGVSKLAGAPTWAEFADSAFSQLVDKKILTYGDLEQISNKAMSPRVKLSLAMSLAKNSNIEIDFKKILHPEGWNKNEKGRRIYKALWAISNNFVTTNYDLWLHLDDADFAAQEIRTEQIPKPIDKKIIYKSNEFLISELAVPNRKTVIHLHGCVECPKEMLLSTANYLETYGVSSKEDTSNQNKTHYFLKQLFKDKDILFIGYQLDELEILEYLILKQRHRVANEESQPRHFIFQSFFRSEEKLIDGVRDYFQKLGVILIPYFRDENNYDELINILEVLSQKIRIPNPSRLEIERLMEGLLDED